MNRTLIAGLTVTVLGVIGYAFGIAGDVGLVEPVDGRAFAVTAVMLGITLVAVGFGERGIEE